MSLTAKSRREFEHMCCFCSSFREVRIRILLDSQETEIHLPTPTATVSLLVLEDFLFIKHIFWWITLKDICITLLCKLYLYRQLYNGLGVSGCLPEHIFKGPWIEIWNTGTYAKLVSNNWWEHEILCCHFCFQWVISNLDKKYRTLTLVSSISNYPTLHT